MVDRKEEMKVARMDVELEASMAVRWADSTAVTMVVRWASQKAGNLDATLGKPMAVT